MNERERIIHLWFEMWLTKQDLGIDNIFAEDVIYTESWSPKYNNLVSGMEYSWQSRCLGNQTIFPQRKSDDCGVVFQK